MPAPAYEPPHAWQPLRPGRIPKTIKLPWNNVTGIAASPDGTLVVVAGELGALARLDVQSWTLEPWPNVDGSVNGLAISADGRRVAVSVAGTRKEKVEIRDATGKLELSFPTPSNVRPRFLASGERLVAQVEPRVDPLVGAGVALLDPRAGGYMPVDVGEAEVSLVCATSEGDDALAFVRRKGGDYREARRALRISSDGTVRDLGPTDWDAANLLTMGNGRAVLNEGHLGWRLVSTADATTLVQRRGPNEAGVAIASDGDGFVVAGIRGKGVKRYDAEGNLRAGGELAAKKMVVGVAAAGGKLVILQHGSPCQLELLG